MAPDVGGSSMEKGLDWALAVWHKFRDPRWYRIKWDDPKYNIVPQKLAA